MANKDDLELLNSGELDLSGCDFTDADLSNRQLAGRNFSNASLRGVRAISTDFSGSIFQATNLQGLNAEDADFSSISLYSGAILGAAFGRAKFRGANLSSCMIQNTDFTGADISGCNFSDTSLLGTTTFDSVKFDERTDFEGARGVRSLSRLLAFAAYDYAGGAFRRRSRPQPMNGEASSFDSFDPGAFAADAFDGPTGATSISEVGIVATGEVIPNPAIESVVSQMKRDPQAFESLARFASRTIAHELASLTAKIPNEPGALDGYEHVRGVLEGLQTGFDELASSVHEASAVTDPSKQTTILRKAVGAARAMSDGFVEWLNDNGNHAGRVIAELGLAGIISGALSMYAGVPAAMSFSATVATMNGKSIWDAIVLFAPSNKKGGN